MAVVYISTCGSYDTYLLSSKLTVRPRHSSGYIRVRWALAMGFLCKSTSTMDHLGQQSENFHHLVTITIFSIRISCLDHAVSCCLIHCRPAGHCDSRLIQTLLADCKMFIAQPAPRPRMAKLFSLFASRAFAWPGIALTWHVSFLMHILCVSCMYQIKLPNPNLKKTPFHVW